MTLEKLIARVKLNTNDPSGSIFSTGMITNYINEAINRIQSSPYFASMEELDASTEIPIILPPQYHYLLAVYSTARCFAQDERHYQATSFMNEFEVKFEELINKAESGEITLIDKDGNAVDISKIDELSTGHVVDVYFDIESSDENFDYFA